MFQIRGDDAVELVGVVHVLIGDVNVEILSLLDDYSGIFGYPFNFYHFFL